jgi:hypothetical protein
MNSRHAAALALLGWYLMAPPPAQKSEEVGLGESFYNFLRKADSFANWEILQSFDSAEQCEKAREDVLSKKTRELLEKAMQPGLAETPIPPKARLQLDRKLAPLPGSKCIASDDSRLAK